jgi:hypothetical protein
MPLKTTHGTISRRPAVHGSPCSIGQVYRDHLHDAEEIDILDSLLYEEGKNAREVWIELHDAGYTDVAHSTINKHRGGTCRCFTIDRDICCQGCKRDFDRCACGDNA